MLVAITVVLIILIYILAKYNKLIKLRNSVKQAQSGIDVYLKQRFDLIPNLVECVKSYSKYEDETFTKITKLRTEYMQKKDIKKGEDLNNNINKIIAVAEQYPELKANEQYLNLQKSLSKMEDQLQAARRIYNGEVTSYNTKINQIPTNLIAALFAFKEMPLFNIEEIEKETIKVEL